jgi:hypothetical protein
LANGNASTYLPEAVSRPAHWLTGASVQIS